MADQNRFDDADSLHKFFHNLSVAKDVPFPLSGGASMAGQVQRGNIEDFRQGDNLLIPITVKSTRAVYKNKSPALRGEPVIVAPEGNSLSVNRCLVKHDYISFNLVIADLTVRPQKTRENRSFSLFSVVIIEFLEHLPQFMKRIFREGFGHFFHRSGFRQGAPCRTFFRRRGSFYCHCFLSFLLGGDIGRRGC
jgi:hypothetical protein